jgi:hypothetical protein
MVITPDHSLIPARPAIPVPEKRVRTEKKGDITEWAEAALSARSDGDYRDVTMEILRERAIQREESARVEAERIKAQVAAEETNRLLHMLPSLADTLRSLSMRNNRSHMLKKDCVEGIIAALQLKTHQVQQGFDLLCTIAPEFISIVPAEKGVPATVAVNRATPYKEVRGKVVEYARSHVKLEQCVSSP